MKTLSLILCVLVAGLPLRAQFTVNYADGDTNSNTYVTSPPNDPTTLNSLDSGTATQTGEISGSGGVVKTGDGTLVLTATEGYTGSTTISGGTLASDGADLSASSGINLTSSSAVFDVSADGGQIIQDLSGVAGSTIRLGQTILSAGTANSTTFAGSIVDPGVDEMGEFLKQGTGTITFTGVNDYHCSTYVQEGTLAMGIGGSVAASCEVFVADGAIFDISGGGNQTIQDMTGSGTINLGANTLTAGGTQLLFSSSFDGVIQGTGGLIMQGTDVQILTGANTYSGGTEVKSGTLMANNSSGLATGVGALTVDSGGTIGGSGTIASTTNTINGTVIAGEGDTDTTHSLTLTSIGTTTFTHATLKFNLNLATPGEGNSVAFGATPSVVFSGTTVSLTLQGVSSGAPSMEYILFTSTTGGGGMGGSIFSGIGLGADGKITGLNLIVNGNSVPQDDPFLYLVLKSNGTGGFNIDVEMAPEPGTWALLGVGLVSLVVWQRRKRFL